MTTEQINAGNKLIAEFMGNRNKFTFGNYATSWDWLMPVVEKINSDGIHEVIIWRAACHICDREEIIIEIPLKGTDFVSLIDSVWKAVVQWIQEFGGELTD